MPDTTKGAGRMVHNAIRVNTEALLDACAELWAERKLVTSAHYLQLSQPRVRYSGEGASVQRSADVVLARDGRIIIKKALTATTYALPDTQPHSTIEAPDGEA